MLIHKLQSLFPDKLIWRSMKSILNTQIFRMDEMSHNLRLIIGSRYSLDEINSHI